RAERGRFGSTRNGQRERGPAPELVRGRVRKSSDTRRTCVRPGGSYPSPLLGERACRRPASPEPDMVRDPYPAECGSDGNPVIVRFDLHKSGCGTSSACFPAGVYDAVRAEGVEKTMSDMKVTKEKGASRDLYPVLPLRDIVVFPYMIVPLFVGREKSINALEEVMRSDKHILLAAQKNAGDDDPATDAIYEMGTLASVLQLLKLPDGTVKVLVEGTTRARIVRYTDNPDFFEAEVERVTEE